ncbi:helix-turn-helix domain-containing protein [Paraburkholderia phosphatilytica]|uniref:helix-turn-helix domain-containing protein n=1 Tax=Paraburkholderia phosphatilytica TaxID=2282883 RepID=UPI000E54D9EE|nr:helix-turn-helix transcriptional regulator [Paraburkholderia phosphatilytica]
MIARPNSGKFPSPLERALLKLGADLSRARRRRRFTQASLAERIQSSVATVRRMEQGDPRIAIETIARALMVFGELDKIRTLLDTAEDDIGLALMDEALPKRVRAKRVTTESGAL